MGPYIYFLWERDKKDFLVILSLYLMGPENMENFYLGPHLLLLGFLYLELYLLGDDT